MANVTEMHTHGPLFDGQADAILHRYEEQAREDIAQDGVNRIHARLGEVLKRNTGFYEAHIHTERQIDDLVVTDTPVVYGPWLEGTGSRNSTTRFKGYHTFRLVGQTLDSDAGNIAERTLHDHGYLAELNA